MLALWTRLKVGPSHMVPIQAHVQMTLVDQVRGPKSNLVAIQHRWQPVMARARIQILLWRNARPHVLKLPLEHVIPCTPVDLVKRLVVLRPPKVLITLEQTSRLIQTRQAQPINQPPATPLRAEAPNLQNPLAIRLKTPRAARVSPNRPLRHVTIRRVVRATTIRLTPVSILQLA